MMSTSTTPPLLPCSTSESARVEIEWEDELQLTNRMIGLFERCPWRFFYTHVLRLGGTRHKSAFIRMHDAVQEVLDWLVQPENSSGEKLDGQFDST